MIPAAELKAALKIEDDQVAEAGYLEALERKAVAFCELKTGRHFGESEQLTEVMEGAGNGELWLANEPAEILSVTMLAAPGGADEVVDPATYVIRGRRVLSAGAWGAEYWPRDVEVVYAPALDSPTETRDRDLVRGVILQLVALWYEVRLPVALGTIAPPVPHGVADALGMLARRRA
jgi:hypothetical protein